MPDVPPPAPRIGFRDLECFSVLVEERHFGRVDERLGITQSALARAIGRLEAELDVPLVTRHSPQITPTRAGESFAAQIPSLLGGLELATAEARRASGGVAPVRIGCVPDLPLQRPAGFSRRALRAAAGASGGRRVPAHGRADPASADRPTGPRHDPPRP